MKEDEICVRIREAKLSGNPLDLVRCLADVSGTRVTQLDAMRYLRIAIPEMPMSVALRVSSSRLLFPENGLDDSSVVDLLRPYYDQPVPRG